MITGLLNQAVSTFVLKLESTPNVLQSLSKFSIKLVLEAIKSIGVFNSWAI